MSTRDSAPVYFDPYNVEIWSDPYAIYRRLREEAPVYYNDQHDFYACSRFEDVERGLMDKETFINGRGNVLRSEEHTSELQSLMRSSYAVFCLKTKSIQTKTI